MIYFKPEEFKCKCGTCDGGIMDDHFVKKLTEARKLANIPFKITSGYRCTTHNKKEGGKSNSAHLRGLAVDIKLKNSNAAFHIISSLLAIGFKRVGYNQKHMFVHVDDDPSLPQHVFFNY
jgi:zinc D-Ala-D-Ala carboxypeptidase